MGKNAGFRCITWKYLAKTYHANIPYLIRDTPCYLHAGSPNAKELFTECIQDSCMHLWAISGMQIHTNRLEIHAIFIGCIFGWEYNKPLTGAWTLSKNATNTTILFIASLYNGLAELSAQRVIDISSVLMSGDPLARTTEARTTVQSANMTFARYDVLRPQPSGRVQATQDSYLNQ